MPIKLSSPSSLIRFIKKNDKDALSKLIYSQKFEASWEAQAINHIQLISPGRSGSRWLANILSTITDNVLHDTNPNLAEVGYLYYFDQISASQALGAYKFSRSKYHLLASQTNSYFIDLDCKTSPIAPLLASKYENTLFLLLLRNPKEFIMSGLARNYFTKNVNPKGWGHLHNSFPYDPNLSVEFSLKDRISLISELWIAIAKIGQQLMLKYPNRVYSLKVTRAFNDYNYLRDFFRPLNLYLPIKPHGHFHRKANQNKKAINLTSETLIYLQETCQFCLTQLDDDFVNKLGLIV